MPLTFAHPAAVLPFSRKSRYINFSAMVLGSMAPDFEYFLRGQPIGEVGHTFTGFIFYNLPLVSLIYLIYHLFVHQPLMNHLPVFLQDNYSNRLESKNTLKLVVFIYSAIFGMFTHIAWDSFTHINGYMVLMFPAVFTNTYNIYGFNIPLYKFLQHGSTLFGIISIVCYMYFRALFQRQKNSTIYTRNKLIFWLILILLTIFFVFLWYLIDDVSILSYGIVVVRIIDSSLISLLLVSLFLKYVKRKNN
ncbi:DUF4184 family protein [Bacillus sp. OAE603]|uniref:DUF4184 family protein n=1 Tax=Gottfriedia sp. OAE603 TaxID=2663872 RepID=UPI00178915EB